MGNNQGTTSRNDNATPTPTSDEEIAISYFSTLYPSVPLPWVSVTVMCYTREQKESSLQDEVNNANNRVKRREEIRREGERREREKKDKERRELEKEEREKRRKENREVGISNIDESSSGSNSEPTRPFVGTRGGNQVTTTAAGRAAGITGASNSNTGTTNTNPTNYHVASMNNGAGNRGNTVPIASMVESVAETVFEGLRRAEERLAEEEARRIREEGGVGGANIAAAGRNEVGEDWSEGMNRAAAAAEKERKEREDLLKPDYPNFPDPLLVYPGTNIIPGVNQVMTLSNGGTGSTATASATGTGTTTVGSVSATATTTVGSVAATATTTAVSTAASPGNSESTSNVIFGGPLLLYTINENLIDYGPIPDFLHPFTAVKIQIKLQDMQTSFSLSENQVLIKLDSMFPLVAKQSLRAAVEHSRNMNYCTSLLLGERHSLRTMVFGLPGEKGNNADRAGGGGGNNVGGGGFGGFFSGGNSNNMNNVGSVVLENNETVPGGIVLGGMIGNSNASIGEDELGGTSPTPRTDKNTAAFRKNNTVLKELQRIPLDPDRHLFKNEIQQKIALKWCAEEFPKLFPGQIKKVLREYNFCVSDAYDVLSESHNKAAERGDLDYLDEREKQRKKKREGEMKNAANALTNSWNPFSWLFGSGKKAKSKSPKGRDRGSNITGTATVEKKKLSNIGAGTGLGIGATGSARYAGSGNAISPLSPMATPGAASSTAIGGPINYVPSPLTPTISHQKILTSTTTALTAEEKKRRQHELNTPLDLLNVRRGRQIERDFGIADQLNRDLNYEEADRTVALSPDEIQNLTGSSSAESLEDKNVQKVDSVPVMDYKDFLNGPDSPEDDKEATDASEGLRRRRGTGQASFSEFKTTADAIVVGKPPLPPSSTTVSLNAPQQNAMSKPRSSTKTKTVILERNYLECCCCFTDDVTAEEAIQCVEHGHVFCKGCVGQYVENLISGQFGEKIIERNAKEQRLICFSPEFDDSEEDSGSGEGENGGIPKRRNSSTDNTTVYDGCPSYFPRDRLLTALEPCTMKLLEEWWQKKSLQRHKMIISGAIEEERPQKRGIVGSLKSGAKSLMKHLFVMKKDKTPGDKTPGDDDESDGRFTLTFQGSTFTAAIFVWLMYFFPDQRNISPQFKRRIRIFKRQFFGVFKFLHYKIKNEVFRSGERKIPIYLCPFCGSQAAAPPTAIDLVRQQNPFSINNADSGAGTVAAATVTGNNNNANNANHNGAAAGIVCQPCEPQMNLNPNPAGSKLRIFSFLLPTTFLTLLTHYYILFPLFMESKWLNPTLWIFPRMSPLPIIWYYRVVVKFSARFAFDQFLPIEVQDYFKLLWRTGRVEWLMYSVIEGKKDNDAENNSSTDGPNVVNPVPTKRNSSKGNTATENDKNGATNVNPKDPSEFPKNLRCLNPNCSTLFCSSCQGEAHFFLSPNIGLSSSAKNNTAVVISRQSEEQQILLGLKACQSKVPEVCNIEVLSKFVSDAMSEKKVRCCPDCGLQFTKSDGCNKMSCPDCYTKMCYICRQKITGYDHFCNHLHTGTRRVQHVEDGLGEVGGNIGGAGGNNGAGNGGNGDDNANTIEVSFCTECEKCPLYKDYDHQLIRKAGENAISLFKKRHPDVSSKIGKTQLEVSGVKFQL